MWADKVLYAVVGIGFVALLYTGFRVVGWINKQEEVASQKAASTITQDNAKQVIRNWLDDFHIETKSKNQDGTIFAYDAVGDSGLGMTIVQYKDRPQYITIAAYMGVGTNEEIKRKLELVPKEQRPRLPGMSSLQAQLISLGVSWKNLTYPFSEVYVYNRVPIANFYESDLVPQLNRLDGALILINNFVRTLGTGERGF